ncbi:hypothetical protein JTB14_002715 [Gonioctena quinquepunctata]|nr:hypothetical protein JTB14_002715 [Gonioctena quinquepunctata]
MFFFPEPDHESDSGPLIEDFSYEESDDSSGEEPPNLEEDQSDPDFIPSEQTTSLPEQHLRRGDRMIMFNMLDCNFVDTPISPNGKLSKEQSPKTPDEEFKMRTVPYQEAVGSLLFAAQVSRPDINFAISYVSCFNQNPGKVH